jgi:PAS domain S-box-containing protein
VLLQRLQMPMLAPDTDGIIVYANPSFAAMLRHPGDDLVGKDVGDFLHPDSHAAITGRDVLRAAGSLLTWHHNEHGRAQSVVTKSVLIRSDDPVLLVGFVDVTDWLRSHGDGALPALH